MEGLIFGILRYIVNLNCLENGWCTSWYNTANKILSIFYLPHPLPSGQNCFKQFPIPGPEELGLSWVLPRGMVTGQIEPCISGNSKALNHWPSTASSSGASFFAWQRRARNEWLVIHRKGPWEGYRRQAKRRLARCLLPAFLCAHIERDVWVRGRIQYLFLTQRIHFLKVIIIHYYSFKILPLFWLVKTTCIIHRPELLLTKFGKNFITVKTGDFKIAAKIEPLTEKTRGRGWVV